MEEDDEIAINQASFQSLPTCYQEFENDWSYAMRRSMQEIVPGVFLGPYASATKKMLEPLQEQSITHIICVRHPLQAKAIKPNFPDLFQYFTIDLADHPSACILPMFPKVKEFIDSCLQAGGKVLIHGNAGISASATFAIAFVMETYGLKFNEAYQVVQRKRFCVNPSETFKRQLMEYETLYLARLQLAHAQPSNGLKRNRDELDAELLSENPSKKLS